MKTIKICFDTSQKKPFLDYAMERAKGLTDYNSHILNYFTLENVVKIVDYFIKKRDTFCNNKGGYYGFGDMASETPTRIYFISIGEELTHRDDILNELQKEFTEDFNSFIEENLYCNLWCAIERCLRLEYEGKLSKYDKLFYIGQIIDF